MFKKKISVSEQLGREAGELALVQLKTPFILTSNLVNGNFTAPIEFFDDAYIKGYATSFISTMADVGSAQLKRRWSEVEKQTFMMSGLEALVGASNVHGFIKNARHTALDTNHKLGSLHANTQIKLMYALNSMDLSLPMFSEAVSLTESTDSYDVVSAFQKVTLCRYIEENYLS